MFEQEKAAGEGPARIIESDLPPELPSFERVINLFEGIYTDVVKNLKNESTLLNFYYPLLAISYHLCKTALDRLKLFPVLGEEEHELQTWFLKYLRLSSQLLEIIIAQLNQSLDEDYDQQLVAYLDQYTNSPFQWTTISLTWTAEWLALILNRINHQGNPPYYIYLKEENGQKFPQMLPRVFEGGGWLSGFGGKLLVLPGVQNLSGRQKAELWNKLLTEDDIYGDKTIDHSVRAEVFDAVIALFPSGEITHLDLCGGKGDFINYLGTIRPDVISVLIDNADQAVDLAKASGVSALVGNAEEPLQIDHNIDIVTIIFAIQWISPKAFVNVLEVLKPGGYLIANVYPPDLKQIEILFMETLRQAGFVNVELKTIRAKNGTDQFIVRAQKPEL